MDLLIIVALVLVNGLFAGAEIAIVAVRRSRLADLVREGDRAARAVQRLKDDPERFFATVQVGITVICATAAAFGGATLAGHMEPHLRGLPVIGPYAAEAALALVIALVSFLSLVLGELVPKSLALRASEPYSLRTAPFLLALSRLAWPLVWILTAASNAVLRLFGDRTTFAEARLSADELREIVGDAAKEGAVDPRVGEIAGRAIEFADLDVADVMVPRARVVAVARDATAEEVLDVSAPPRARVCRTARSPR